MTLTTAPLRAAAALSLAALLLAGCSGTNDDSSDRSAASTGGDAGGVLDSNSRPDADAPTGAEGGNAAGGPAAEGYVAPARGRPAAVDRAIAYVGELRVEVDDVSTASATAIARVRGVGGTVAAQESSFGDDSTALLTFSVPPTQFDRLLVTLGELGRPQGQTVSSEDVTEQLVDLDARLRTAKASADRVRALLARAGSIAEIIALEREIAAREAEVESLSARLRALDGRVESSTLTLLLAADRDELGEGDDHRGFLSGLRDGWDAFVTSAVVLATALGAALPFAAVAALLSSVAIVWRRRRGDAAKVAEQV